VQFRFPTGTRLLSQMTYWFPILPLLVIFSLILWLLQDSLYPLHHRWTQWDGSYSHGYLLVVVGLLFVFRDLRPKLQFVNAHWLYIPLIIGPSLVWSFGYATQIAVLQQMALPALLAFLILPLIGLRRFWTLLFPLALLYLAIPMWEVLLPPLRAMTSYVATWGVRLLGVPAFIDGFSFTLPYGTVVIAGSCAGLSYFLMGLVLACINSGHRHYSFKHTLMSIGLMCVLAIVSNWFRVYSLILIAYYSQMQSSLVYDHGNYGWWIFFTVFCLFLWLVRNFPEYQAVAVRNQVATKLNWVLNGSLVLLVTGALALAVPIWLLTSGDKPMNVNQQRVNPATAANQEWTSLTPAAANSQFRPGYSGYDQAFYWQTSLAGRPWTVGQLIYQTQKQGKELISDSNSLSSDRVQITELEALAVNSKLAVYLIGGRSSRLVVTTLQIGNRLEIEAMVGKVVQFSEMLAGRPAVAFWYASTQCTSYRCETELAELAAHPATLQSWISASALY